MPMGEVFGLEAIHVDIRIDFVGAQVSLPVVVPFETPIVDLHLQTAQHAGFRFGGLNGSWKYKPRGPFLYEQAEVESLLSSFPAVDILLSHNSPRGIHDREDTVHQGFEGLNPYISRVRPKLVIHGHQHTQRESTVGETRVIGVYGYKVIEIPE